MMVFKVACDFKILEQHNEIYTKIMDVDSLLTVYVGVKFIQRLIYTSW